MRHIRTLLLVTLMATGSCKKLIEIKPPQVEVGREQVFSNDGTAISAATGCYYKLVQSNGLLFTHGLSVYPGLSADELAPTTPSSTYDPFLVNDIEETNSTVATSFWAQVYTVIFHTNAVIEGLESSTGVTPPVKAQLTGEMLFLRSLLYFYMVNLYSDVPLVLSTDLNVISLMPRTPQDKIWQQLQTDLQVAKGLLSTQYPLPGRFRANKLAAAALLARVHLYRKNWQGAIDEATEVIASGTYSLGSLVNTFLTSSPEAILQFAQPANSVFPTGEGYVFNPSAPGLKPGLALTNTLQSSFEAGDQRFEKWVGRATIAGSTFLYPYKYKVGGLLIGGGSRTEEIIVLRLSELYLIRAEAAAALGRLPEGIKDLDAIRARAGLPKIADTQPAIGKEELEELILHERQVEFFAELGHRWLDLKRTGRADAVLSATKPGWKRSAALYPIPNNELHSNPFLTQNDNY